MDRKLSRLQNFVLDATGPLAAAYDELVGENEAYPDPDRIQQAIQLSLRILGNASAQISQERRTKALSRLNPDLKSLVEDEDFSNAAPNLFGAGFEKKAKERSKAVTCLRKASSSDLKKIGEHNSRRFPRIPPSVERRQRERWPLPQRTLQESSTKEPSAKERHRKKADRTMNVPHCTPCGVVLCSVM